MPLTIHVDGGSRGNPGPAGGGVVIARDDDAIVHEGAYFFGRQTNNAAEYLALIRALQRVGSAGETTVVICSDSELLVRQITGEYRVKNAKLAELHGEVQRLLLRIPCWSFRHVRREFNARADELANLAMDRGEDTIVTDADSPVSKRPPGSKRRDADPPAPPRAKDAAPATSAPTAPTDVSPVRTVRVTAKPGASDACPAGGPGFTTVTIGASLPAGICTHAMLACLPTILAIQNTEPGEFAAVPLMTARCMRSGCGASFQIGPATPSNGAHNSI